MYQKNAVSILMNGIKTLDIVIDNYKKNSNFIINTLKVPNVTSLLNVTNTINKTNITNTLNVLPTSSKFSKKYNSNNISNNDAALIPKHHLPKKTHITHNYDIFFEARDF